jgi:Ca2+-binding EF-hand superfamily protein
MRRYLITVICLIAVQLTVGCRRNVSTVSDSAPAVSPKPTVAKISDEKGAAKLTNTKKPIPLSKAEPKPEPKPNQSATDAAKKKIKVATKQNERMAILSPDGPIAVDVFLTIDGRPQAEIFNEVVDQVLTAADTDKDGRPTWKELVANKAYLSSQSQRDGMPPGNVGQLKMWEEQFDRNRDGQIQRDEAASWLGRGAGMRARAFDVRGSRSYSSLPSTTSRIWKLLDVDGNGRLSKAELARGPEKLLALDENDDGIIDPEELRPLREQLRIDGDQASTVGNTTNAYAAIYLEPQYEVDRLDYLLGDLYARGRTLRPASFAALAGDYKRLDADGDDQLTQNELASMRTMSPQLKLAVDFHSAKNKRQTSLAVPNHVPEIAVVEHPAADRAVLKLGNTRIVVSAYDRESGQASAVASGAQIRMVVHDQCDAVGELLDADANGRLGEREIATCAEALLKYDANHDGQITNNELPYTMIATVVRGELPGEQSLYRPVSKSMSPALADAPSWFVSADYNGDGDVSRREFLGSAEQFSRLDKNKDGFISADEAKQAASAPGENRQ